MHDLQDHAAGGRAALGVGVDADGLLGGACVLLAVYVDPAEQKWRLRVAAIQSFNARLNNRAARISTICDFYVLFHLVCLITGSVPSILGPR